MFEWSRLRVGVLYLWSSLSEHDVSRGRGQGTAVHGFWMSVYERGPSPGDSHQTSEEGKVGERVRTLLGGGRGLFEYLGGGGDGEWGIGIWEI